MKEFTERFSFLRNNILKISMGDMGKALGVNTSAISKYEKGESKPGMGFLVKVCEEYEISANWLILNKPPIKLADINNSYIDSAIESTNKDKELEDKLTKATLLLKEIKQEMSTK